MGQQTPPSPATSNEDLVTGRCIVDTTSNNTTSRIQTGPGGNVGLYWQNESSRDDLVYEAGYTAFTQQLTHVPSARGIFLNNYTSSVDAAGEIYGPSNNSGTSRYTPETSPPVNSRATNRGAALDRQTISRTTVSTRSKTSRAIGSSKKNRDQKRRDTSGRADKPLSEIALEVPGAVIPDAAAFATRSIDIRREEAADAKKVKRPLNAFMLYRRSYQNIAKTKCSRNNHQQVSSVCGYSWSHCETSDVVREFTRLASIEKQMHEQAFPDYKYDPAPVKKPGEDDAISSRGSETSGIDYKARRRLTKQDMRKREAIGSRNSQAPQLSREEYPEGASADFLMHDTPTMNVSPYWTSPALRSFATPYEQEPLAYIDSGVYPKHLTASPGNCVISGSPLPISDYVDHNVMDPRLCFSNDSIDTILLTTPFAPAYDGCSSNSSLDGGARNGWYQQAPVKPEFGIYMPDLDGGGSYNAYLKGTDEDWEVKKLDEGSQFEDWISQTEGSSV